MKPSDLHPVFCVSCGAILGIGVKSQDTLVFCRYCLIRFDADLQPGVLNDAKEFLKAFGEQARYVSAGYSVSPETLNKFWQSKKNP